MFCPIPWFTNNPIEEEYSTIRKLRQKNATLAPQEYLSYQQGTASRSSSAASLNEQDEKEIPKTPEEDNSSAVVKESTIEATFTAKTEPPTPGTSLCENSIVTEDDVEDDSQSTVEAATEDDAEDDSQSTAEAATEDVVVKTLYTGRSIVVEEESQSAIDAAADTSPVANINSATDAKASPIRPQAISFEQVSKAVDERTDVVDSGDKEKTKMTTSAFPKPISVLVVLLAIALALLFGNGISELTGSIVNVATDYQTPFPFETAEAEKLAKEEAVRKAERLAKEEAAIKANAAEAERLAKENAAIKAKAAEAERLAKENAAIKAKAAEAERLAKEAREAKAAEAERLAKEEAVRRAMLERRLANEEAARKAEATEAETLAKEEAVEAEKLTEESTTDDVTASVDSDEELEVDTD